MSSYFKTSVNRWLMYSFNNAASGRVPNFFQNHLLHVTALCYECDDGCIFLVSDHHYCIPAFFSNDCLQYFYSLGHFEGVSDVVGSTINVNRSYFAVYSSPSDIVSTAQKVGLSNSSTPSSFRPQQLIPCSPNVCLAITDCFYICGAGSSPLSNVKFLPHVLDKYTPYLLQLHTNLLKDPSISHTFISYALSLSPSSSVEHLNSYNKMSKLSYFS